MWGLSADLLGRSSQKAQAGIIITRVYTFLRKMCLRWTWCEQKTILLLTKPGHYTLWSTIRATDLFSMNVFNLLSVFHQVIFIDMFCIRLELVGITILSYRYRHCLHCATMAHKYISIPFFHLLIKNRHCIIWNCWVKLVLWVRLKTAVSCTLAGRVVIFGNAAVRGRAWLSNARCAASGQFTMSGGLIAH